MGTDDVLSDNYLENDDDVGLSSEDQAEYKRDQEEWFRMEKGQNSRVAFVYYHTLDYNAVAVARKAKPDMTPEQMREVARTTLADRAKELNKTMDQLTKPDRVDIRSIHFKRIMAHYQQGLGFVISRLGRDGKESDDVWKKLPEPKKYYTTVLLIYPTDRKGDIDREKVSTHWKVMPWRFGRGMYEKFWKLNESLGSLGQSLATQDLKLECKDAQFQNIDPNFCGAAIWQKNERFRALVLEKAIELYPKLVPFREMTTDQLRAKLGLGGPVVSDVSAGGDFADLLETV
jgi:hypothetical protein